MCKIARVIGLALEGVYPADVTHGCFYALDVELILQTDREAVKGTEWLAGLGVVVV